MAWAELADRRDLLRLLALACRGLRATGLEEYTPPSEELAEALAWPQEEGAAGGHAGPVDRGEMRRQQVAMFAARFGGEAS